MKINLKRHPVSNRTIFNVEHALLYPGGYSDADVERRAHEDGNAAVHNPSIWGENTEPHGIHITNEAHGANADLIGHDLRAREQEVFDRLETDILNAKATEQDTLDTVERWREAAIDEVRLSHEINHGELSVPSRRALVWITGGLFGLFFGELAILALSFEVFRLSDTPLLFGLKLTNELHLAAMTAVTALLILAHETGYKLLLIAYAVGRRRKAITTEAKAKLPRPSIFDAAIALGCVVGAWYVLMALSAIRVDYLRSRGVQSTPGPFLLLQAGIFLAAVVLSYHLSHPYGRKWSSVTRRAERTKKIQKASEDLLIKQVGKVNADIDLRDTLLSQAGHHVGVSDSNAERQNHLYARRAILSQPEPTTERLFPETLPEPVHRAGDGLKQFLIGITDLSTFEKLTTDTVIQRREEIRRELVGLAAELRKRSESKPDESSDVHDETLGGESAGGNTFEANSPVGAEHLDYGADVAVESNGHPAKAPR
jgi:hypothetical protein